MDRQQIAMKLTLEALELSLSVETFNERLVVQKAICLAQAAGSTLGYHFRWYLRGPYSPALTRDAFAVVSEIASDTDESQRWRLDDHSTARLKKLRALIPQVPADRPQKLELLASVYYLVSKGQVTGQDVDALRQKLKKFGKPFTEGKIRGALKELGEHDLIK